MNIDKQGYQPKESTATTPPTHGSNARPPKSDNQLIQRLDTAYKMGGKDAVDCVIDLVQKCVDKIPTTLNNVKEDWTTALVQEYFIQTFKGIINGLKEFSTVYEPQSDIVQLIKRQTNG